MKKRLTNILTAGLLLGMLALALQRYLSVSTDQFLHYYWILGVAAVLLIFGFNVLRQILFLQKQKALHKILMNEKDPDRFLLENQKLLSKMRTPYNRALLMVNLSVGYCAKKDYAKAKATLLTAPHQALRGIPLITYHIDLTYVSFMLHENQKALELMAVYGDTDFALVKSMPSLGGHVAVLKIFEKLINNQYEEATALLEAARINWSKANINDDLDHLTALLQKQS